VTVRERLTGFARAVGAYVPDATTMAIVMLLALLAVAMLASSEPGQALDAFHRGLWMMLPFSMQVVLMLVLSTVLSTTPFFRRAVERLAGLPRTVIGVVLGTVLTTAALGYLYWGLAIALGPLIAVQFARAAEARGLRVDFPCLLASQFAAGSVWQFGLSSTAALLVATPGHFLEKATGVMPLGTTIWSTPALCLVVAFPLALAALTRVVMPIAVQPMSAFPAALAFLHEDGSARVAASPARGAAQWAENTRVLPALLVVALVGWLYHHFVTKQAAVDLNAMVTLLLAAALLSTGTLAAFGSALQGAIGSSAQVIVLYQLYGGIAGLLQFTPLGERLAAFFAEYATAMTFPALIALAGTAVAIFVPSSGGQWIIQGFVTTETAAAVGVSPQLGLLSLGIGDQMGNLLSPFWMIIAAGIARVDFRTMFGYSMVFAALWFGLGVAIFTFVPV
jgi:short-chain fatty acids transporter